MTRPLRIRTQDDYDKKWYAVWGSAIVHYVNSGNFTWEMSLQMAYKLANEALSEDKKFWTNDPENGVMIGVLPPGEPK